MEKNVLYYQITRDLFLLSDPSYDIDEVGIDNPILNECELYNNGYEHVITEWRKQLNVSFMYHYCSKKKVTLLSVYLNNKSLWLLRSF